MNSRTLKLSVLGMFVLFAGGVFFISGGVTGAQNKRAAVLDKVREYKTWKQVTKPRDTAPGQQPSIVVSPIQIDISSISG